MQGRSTLKLIAFLCYVPALVLALTSLFLPWVYIENVARGEMGLEVNPLVPSFVAVGAAVATIVGKSRGIRRLASGSHIALGLLALAWAWEVYGEAKLGHGPYFDVEISPAVIRPEIGLLAFATSGALLIVAGVIDALRPHGR